MGGGRQVVHFTSRHAVKLPYAAGNSVSLMLQHEDRTGNQTEVLSIMLTALVKDHTNHCLIKSGLVFEWQMKQLRCSIRKGKRTEFLAQLQGSSHRSSLELTQPKVLLAAISQDVNELGFICSPFQLPCLVQVLKGKRWDLIKRGKLRTQDSWAEPLRSHVGSLNITVISSLRGFSYTVYLSSFPSGKTPTPPSSARSDVPFVLKVLPDALSGVLFPSLPLSSRLL